MLMQQCTIALLPPSPVLKGHFSIDCSSANILNIIRLPSVRQHASLIRW